MKKILFIALFGSAALTACDVLEDVADTVTSGTGTGTEAPSLTNAEVISGLKEALTIGAKNGAGLASKVDGFWKNDRLRIPFPPEAEKVKQKALDLGLDGKVEQFEMTMNRAAEEAAKEAAPIFVDAITGMSVQDGFEILNGGDGAATKYLQDKTTAGLRNAFQPKVKAAIDKVQLTKYWEPLAKAYNTATMLTGGEEIDPNLEQYITTKAIDGLFILVREEENKIRKDPVSRVTDTLKKVFGSLDD